MKILNKFNFKLRFLRFYENWIIPPQNESLLELKRREFRERTKYLKPEVYYGLTEEDKQELRNEGYFVDLDKDSIKKIRNFHLSYNRHEGKYQIYNDNYNQMIYNTKYYYQDQAENLFLGDEHYLRKTWRRRSPFKRYTAYLLITILLIYIHSKKKDRQHRKLRRFYQEQYQDQFNFKEKNNIDTLIKFELEERFEEILLSSLIKGFKASIILRIDDETCIKGIAKTLSEFKTNMSDKSFKICMVVLLSESYYKENINRLCQTINSDTYSGISNISFYCFNSAKDELEEKQFYFYLPESLVVIDKNNKGTWGTKVNDKKIDLNKHQLSIKLGDLHRNEALEAKTADYDNKI